MLDFSDMHFLNLSIFVFRSRVKMTTQYRYVIIIDNVYCLVIIYNNQLFYRQYQRINSSLYS